MTEASKQKYIQVASPKDTAPHIKACAVWAFSISSCNRWPHARLQRRWIFVPRNVRHWKPRWTKVCWFNAPNLTSHNSMRQIYLQHQSKDWLEKFPKIGKFHNTCALYNMKVQNFFAYWRQRKEYCAQCSLVNLPGEKYWGSNCWPNLENAYSTVLLTHMLLQRVTCLKKIFR